MMNIDELLNAERGRKGFTRSERDAMWSGVQSSIGVATAGAVAVAAATKAAASTAPSAAATSASSAKLAAWKLMTLLSVVAIGGAGVGAAAHAKWGAPKIVTVEASRPAALVAAPPTADNASTPSVTAIPTQPTPTAATSATPRTTTAARATTAQPSAALSAAKDPSLARERTLLDMARTALSRGDASGALASLDAHAREFPSSQLTEEREVLAIQALASAGRMPEARKRAASFRARFVNSPLRSIVDEATQ